MLISVTRNVPQCTFHFWSVVRLQGRGAVQQSSAGQVSTERGDPEASESPGIRADWVPGRFGRTGFLADSGGLGSWPIRVFSTSIHSITTVWQGFFRIRAFFQIRRFSDTFGSQMRALHQLHNQRSATGARAADPKHLSRHAVTITTSSHSQVCLIVNPFPSLKVIN